MPIVTMSLPLRGGPGLPQPAWELVGEFTGAGTAQARCVSYRLRPLTAEVGDHPQPAITRTMLEALARLAADPEAVIETQAAGVINRYNADRPHRRSRVTLLDRLRILATVERALPIGGRFVDVAKHHGVDSTVVRDTVMWASSSAPGAILFNRISGLTPDSATLTPVGRHLLHTLNIQAAAARKS